MEVLALRLTPQLTALVCDRCNVRYEDSMEQGEFFRIDTQGGYNSIFGDMNPIRLDLCQYCVRATLGPWLKIDGLLPKKEAVWHQHVFASAEAAEYEDLVGRLDVIDDGASIYLYDPLTSVPFAWFDSRERAVEFARDLLTKIT